MLYMYHKTEVKIVGIKNFELIAQCIKFRNELFIVNFTENEINARWTYRYSVTR